MGSGAAQRVESQRDARILQGLSTGGEFAASASYLAALCLVSLVVYVTSRETRTVDLTAAGGAAAPR